MKDSPKSFFRNICSTDSSTFTYRHMNFRQRFLNNGTESEINKDTFTDEFSFVGSPFFQIGTVLIVAFFVCKKCR